MIVRTGRRIPGVTPIAGIHHPISVCRMAVGDAYGAKEWREDEGDDEIAYRTERISRRVCRAVSEHSFRTAATLGAKVYGGPKWTVSPVYEGMLKEEMDAAAGAPSRVRLRAGPDRRDLRRPRQRRRHRAARDPDPEPRRRPAQRPRDADVRLDRRRRVGAAQRSTTSSSVAAAMAEAPHGTAPALLGKDIANPMAMVLACAAVLHYGAERGATRQRVASRAIYEATLEAAAAGIRTPDLGGQAGHDRGLREIAARVVAKREAWSSLGGPGR